MKKLLLLLATLTLPALAGAQGAVGTILGQVSDATGAVVPGAGSPSRRPTPTCRIRATTGPTGNYTVPYLNPGHYSVQVEAAGFSRTRIQHINLEVDQTVRADAVLKVGTTGEQIEVSAQAVQLDSESASIGQLDLRAAGERSAAEWAQLYVLDDSSARSSSDERRRRSFRRTIDAPRFRRIAHPGWRESFCQSISRRRDHDQ